MKFQFAIFTSALFLLLSACGKVESSSDLQGSSEPTIPHWASLIDSKAMIGKAKIKDCTLSGGTQTQCVSFTLQPQPSAFEIGPWCPRNIADGPNVSGIWLSDNKVYDADGQFIQDLASFYKDDNWQLFNAKTGKINVTDSKISCEAAARPDVDPAYQNHCVECKMSYLPANTNMTYNIPILPQATTKISSRIDHAGVGVAFSGARLDASAPIDAILSAYTVAPFDDCGGHINPNVGYHIHAVTDSNCLTGVSVSEDHAMQIGIAMDGFPLHRRLNPDGSEPSDLDQCRGHDVGGNGYHYHVSAPETNAILPCHSGQTGCASENEDACNASARVRRGRPPKNED